MAEDPNEPPDDYLDAEVIRKQFQSMLGLSPPIEAVRAAVHEVLLRRDRTAEAINSHDPDDRVTILLSFVYGWIHGADAVMKDLK